MPPNGGAERGPTQEGEMARTIDAYAASRDARSGERQVTRLPSWRDLIRQVRRDA